MKYNNPDSKPNRERESSPGRYPVLDRPDTGLKNYSDLGPSSEAHKDNPHKRVRLSRHAWMTS